MGENSKIEWTDHTFNTHRGCTKVSAGCANCYAEKLSQRNPAVLGVWGDNGTRVVAAESAWRDPLRWNRVAQFKGERHRVFCDSLADVFEDWSGILIDSWDRQMWDNGTDHWMASSRHRSPDVPADPPYRSRPNEYCRPLTMDDVRERLFKLIDATPYLDWLIVTKRPQNVLRMTYDRWCKKVPGHVSQNEGDGRVWDWPSNAWMGTSVEDQKAANERIPHLLKIPATARFLSMEPLLGPVSLTTECLIPATGDHPDMVGYMAGPDDGKSLLEKTRAEALQKSGIDWVIVGGESGPAARPMHPDWVRSIRDQCQSAGVPFFFKQHGEWTHLTTAGLSPDHHYPGRNLTQKLSGDTTVCRVGKKAAGRILDGRTWDEVPTPLPRATPA